MNHLFWGAIFAFLNFNLNFGDVTIGLLPGFIGWFLIWKGLTELRDQSVRFGKVKIPAVVLMVYSTATYMLDLFAIFLDICTENKHIFLLGGMNLADEVDYPSGCDLLILPYAGYRDNLAKADQMMNCLRPDPGHQAGILDRLFHIREKTEENRIGPERRKNGRPGGQSPGRCPGGRTAAKICCSQHCGHAGGRAL